MIRWLALRPRIVLAGIFLFLGANLLLHFRDFEQPLGLAGDFRNTLAISPKGEMIYEPAGALYATSENAEPGMPSKILGFMLVPLGSLVVEGK